MDRIEQLELMVAELKAEVAYWKSYVRNEKPFNPPGSNPCAQIARKDAALENAITVAGQAVQALDTERDAHEATKFELAVAKESLALTEEAFLTMKNRLKELVSLLHSNYQGMGH